MSEMPPRCLKDLRGTHYYKEKLPSGPRVPLHELEFSASNIYDRSIAA